MTRIPNNRLIPPSAAEIHSDHIDPDCAPLAEVVPGLADIRAARWSWALSDFGAAAAMDCGRSAQAFAAWERGIRNPSASAFIARALGSPSGTGPLYDRTRSAAFIGAARAEFTCDLWQELPAREGFPVVTIPVFASDMTAVDIIAIEPQSRRWASLTELHNGMLGAPFEDTSVSVRLPRHPLDWVAGDGSTIAGLGCHPPAVCILDCYSCEVERLLLGGWPLICDDEEQADALAVLAVEARQRSLPPLPTFRVIERRAAA